MNDIGVVEYSKDTDKKCIHANWFYIKNGKKVIGTGIATGELSNNFQGEYFVTYYSQSGVELSKYNLIITECQDHYELKWIANGQVEYFGVGIEKDNKLFAGWRSYQNVCA
jgi:hypothetical protein